MTLTHAVKVAGDPLFDVAAGEIVIISSVIADGTEPGDVEKDGAGTLVLTGNNTYTGGTILLEGTLELRHVNAAGIGANNFIRYTAGSQTLEIENSALSSNSFGNTIDDFGTRRPDRPERRELRRRLDLLLRRQHADDRQRWHHLHAHPHRHRRDELYRHQQWQRRHGGASQCQRAGVYVRPPRPRWRKER